jgi:hypothetical protein
MLRDRYLQRCDDVSSWAEFDASRQLIRQQATFKLGQASPVRPKPGTVASVSQYVAAE